jgi:FG-GAP repeat
MSRRVWWIAAPFVIGIIVPAMTVAAPSPAADYVHTSPQAVGTASWRDFNGDTVADLAIGAPGENLGAGAVHVIYGSSTGLTAGSSQLFTEATFGIADDPQSGDHFGQSLASGDFDGDGLGDLAIGVPFEDWPLNGETLADAGAVHVLFGSEDGLTTGDSLYLPAALVVPYPDLPYASFGFSLAAYDNKLGASDGVAELAVGVPGSSQLRLFDVSGASPAAIGGTFFNEPELQYGYAVTAGDFNSQPGDDIAVGAAGTGQYSAGYVDVLLSKAGQGFSHAGLDDSNLSVDLKDQDHFGSVLSAGDLDGDGIDELIAGVPKRDVGGTQDAGAVFIFNSHSNGPSPTDITTLSLATAGIAGDPAASDWFGAALATGLFDTGTTRDLAVGIPNRDARTRVNSGVVMVLYNGSQESFLSQRNAGVASDPEDHDHLGSVLAGGNWGNGGRTDLAIGVPDEDVGTKSDAGVVNVLYGSATGLNGTNSQLWSQNTTGIQGNPELSDHFGAAVR